MAQIFGTNVIFYIERDGVDVPICYAETNTLSISASMVEATRAPLSKWFDAIPGQKSYSISASGVMVDDESTTYNVGSMEDVIISGALVNWKMKDSANPLKIISGQCYFVNHSQDTAAGDFAKFSLDCQGVGELTVTYFIPGTSSFIYFGTQNNNDDPIDFSAFIEGDPNKDITITYGSGLDGVFYWVAYSVGAQNKNAWQDLSNALNGGGIGAAGDLFETRQITIGGNPFWLHITRYETGFGGAPQMVKFYVAPGSSEILPPTNLTASFENVDATNASIEINYTASISAGVTGYEVRIINTTATSTEYTDVGDVTTANIGVGRGADYLIAVRAYSATAVSAWTPDTTLSIPSSAQVQNIFFNIGRDELGARIAISATAVINTDVTVTYEVGFLASRVERSAVVPAGSNSVFVYPSTQNELQSPVILSLNPLSFGNQNYAF